MVLHIIWTIVLGGVAFFWILGAQDIWRGLASMPSLKGTRPLPDADCPTVSILFAAREEAEKLPAALETFLALDYPRYEVVAVDDRSEDATGAILENAARRDSRLKAIHADALPEGWLGKPHALQRAYEQSSGEWLVFTDADVHFAPDLLRRALAMAREHDWEHMTLLARVEVHDPAEKIAMIFFGLGFLAGIRPWRVSNPASGGYVGVGAFQLLRRSAYETLGTHRRLAMEVVDDMKLGKLAKDSGIRSGAALAGDAVSVHWHAGIGNIIRGTTKNFFAASGFRVWKTSLQVLSLLLMCVLPAASLPFVHGWARVFACIAVGLPLVAAAAVAIEFQASPGYAFTFPLGALLFAWMLTRSTIVTLWRRGVVWRGTFYPLEDLRRGVV